MSPRSAAGLRARLRSVAGGPARLRVLVLLAAVLALQTADQSTVAAVAPELQHAFAISNTQIGLLATASTGVGALATLPMGVLADRLPRVRLLTITVVIWSLATILGGAAVSYPMLLVSRVALGGVVAAAFPLVSSLAGDLFPVADRGRLWGYVLSGELLGVAFGLGLSGTLAGLASWRWSFWLLAALSLLLAITLPRQLPEPARGGASRLEPGATTIPAVTTRPSRPASDSGAAGTDPDHTMSAAATRPGADEIARQVRRHAVAPIEDRVITSDPAGWSLPRALRYLLSTRSNLSLVVASGLGYFYLTGVETFAVEYVRGRYGLGQSAASLLLVGVGSGAIVGVLIAGRVADRLAGRGITTARVIVGGIAFAAAAVCLLPGLLSGSLLLAVPLLFLGAAGLGSANPPLDAARLDIVHSRLWGRAEAARTALRSLFVAIAPLLFGYLSVQLAHTPTTSPTSGLSTTFLLGLIAPLAAAGILLLPARRDYPRDVATALASEPSPSDQRSP